MTATLSVRVDGQGAFEKRTAATLASLPRSFHATSGLADVVAIDGSGNWVERAQNALESGVRGILVGDPEPQDAGTLLSEAAQRGVMVLLDTRWARIPGVSAAAEEFRLHVTDEGLIEGEFISACDEKPLLTELPAQLALIRAISGPLAEARLVAAGIHGYTVLGLTASGVRFKVANVRTDAIPATARVRSIGRASSVDLSIPDPATSQPARFTVTTAEGATLRPTIFESGRRAGLRALHSAVVTGRPLLDLDGFVADTMIVAALADDLPATSPHGSDSK